MSGGSHEYLYMRDLDELIGSHQSSLEQMIKDLENLGYAKDAASEAYQLLLTLRQTENRVDTIMKRLSPIFKAVEWHKSGDSTDGAIHRALREYRGEK